MSTTVPARRPASGLPRRFGDAWLSLAAALALHVTDEALTGFLDFYNPIVLAIRSRVPGLLLPTFTFPVWLAGLAVGIALLVALAPAARQGRRWLVLLALPFSVLMVGNGLAHVIGSLYLHRLLPGVISSPVLIAAATATLLAAIRLTRTAPTAA